MSEENRPPFRVVKDKVVTDDGVLYCEAIGDFMFEVETRARHIEDCLNACAATGSDAMLYALKALLADANRYPDKPCSRFRGVLRAAINAGEKGGV